MGNQDDFGRELDKKDKDDIIQFSFHEKMV